MVSLKFPPNLVPQLGCSVGFVALQPAVVPYASPLKMFEYMLLEKAIAAPDTANIREILADDQTALLFEPGSVAEFTENVARLCNDSALRERLGRAAGARIRQAAYTWQENAAKINEIAQRLLHAHTDPR